MSEETAQSVINKVREARKEIWMKEPKEVTNLRTHKMVYGHLKQSFVPHTFCYGMVMGQGDMSWILREAAKNRSTDLNSLKVATKLMYDFYGGLWGAWYGLKSTENLLKTVSTGLDKIKTKKEYLELMAETTLYLNRLSEQVELIMPWYKLSLIYEWISKGKKK